MSLKVTTKPPSGNGQVWMVEDAATRPRAFPARRDRAGGLTQVALNLVLDAFHWAELALPGQVAQQVFQLHAQRQRVFVKVKQFEVALVVQLDPQVTIEQTQPLHHVVEGRLQQGRFFRQRPFRLDPFGNIARGALQFDDPARAAVTDHASAGFQPDIVTAGVTQADGDAVGAVGQQCLLVAFEPCAVVAVDIIDQTAADHHVGLEAEQRQHRPERHKAPSRPVSGG